MDLEDLLAEARFYGLDPDLLSPLTDSSLFDPFALHRSLALPLPGRDPPSALSAAPSGSLLVAHGSKITAFDPALRRHATVLTRFPAIDSLSSPFPPPSPPTSPASTSSTSPAPAPSPTPSTGPPSLHRHYLRYRQLHRPGHRRLPRSPLRQLRILPEEFISNNLMAIGQHQVVGCAGPGPGPCRARPDGPCWHGPRTGRAVPGPRAANPKPGTARSTGPCQARPATVNSKSCQARPAVCRVRPGHGRPESLPNSSGGGGSQSANVLELKKEGKEEREVRRAWIDQEKEEGFFLYMKRGRG